MARLRDNRFLRRFLGWKLAAAVAGVVILLLVLGSLLFSSIMGDQWEVRRAAVLAAYEQTILAKVDKVDPFVGDKTYIVIQGQDKIGQKLIVWVGEDELIAEMAADGISPEQAVSQTMSKGQGIEVLRVLPGILDNEKVWEVFYKMPPENGGRSKYYYDYYTFKDGTPIDTWRLSIQ